MNETINVATSPIAKEAGKQFVLAAAVSLGSMAGLLAFIPLSIGLGALYEKSQNRKTKKTEDE